MLNNGFQEIIDPEVYNEFLRYNNNFHPDKSLLRGRLFVPKEGGFLIPIIIIDNSYFKIMSGDYSNWYDKYIAHTGWKLDRHGIFVKYLECIFSVQSRGSIKEYLKNKEK